jgi:hypothetical protein
MNDLWKYNLIAVVLMKLSDDKQRKGKGIGRSDVWNEIFPAE